MYLWNVSADCFMSICLYLMCALMCLSNWFESTYCISVTKENQTIFISKKKKLKNCKGKQKFSIYAEIQLWYELYNYIKFKFDGKAKKIVRCLSFYDHLLLVLMKLKLGLYNKDFVFRFKIKPVTVLKNISKLVTNSRGIFAVFNSMARKRNTQKESVKKLQKIRLTVTKIFIEGPWRVIADRGIVIGVELAVGGNTCHSFINARKESISSFGCRWFTNNYYSRYSRRVGDWKVEKVRCSQQKHSNTTSRFIKQYISHYMCLSKCKRNRCKCIMIHKWVFNITLKRETFTGRKLFEVKIFRNFSIVTRNVRMIFPFLTTMISGINFSK